MKWNFKPTPGKLLAIARNQRYQLLEDKCKELDIPLLFTAHQQEDHIETFFMRLAHSSGIDGLFLVFLFLFFFFLNNRIKRTCWYSADKLDIFNQHNNHSTLVV